MQFQTYLLGIALLFIHANAQLDPEICPGGPTTIPDPNWRPVPPRFEIIGELVAADGVMEVSQAFAPNRDAIALNAINPFSFYWNYQTNEHFDILTAIEGNRPVVKCLRTPIGPDSQTSVIRVDTLLLKPSALLGYDARNQLNPNWGLNADSDGDLRGIPVKKFKSCFFASDIRATVAATYYVSDVTKFQAYLPSNQSIILQIDVAIKSQMGKRESYSYNFFRYIPNPSRFEERQALETPAGVYCANRTSTLNVPSNIPGRASSNIESYVPPFNNSIVSSHSLYDTEFQFSRFDAWFPDPSGGPNWYHLTEIHDFAIGLSYGFNHTNRQCLVRDISPNGNDAVTVDGSPNLIQMGDPQHLFLMDDISFQYTGEKRCRDRVWCHVWIGEKPMPNNTVQHLEWYWASSVNGEPLTQWIPMKLIIKSQYIDIPIFTFELTIFNFRRNPMTIFEIEYTLAECYRALGPAENYNLAVLSFKVKNEKNYPVYQNLNALRLHIWESLIFTMFIRPIRLSHLIVDQDGTDIIVTFTLLDVPPRKGPVENPIEEANLDKAIERLSSIIDANGLAFRAKYGTKQVVLRATSGSLNVDHVTSKTEYMSSGPRITGLWIGLILVGLLIGGVGGFFAFQKLSKR